jgi:large subunit ribosomal protein L17
VKKSRLASTHGHRKSLIRNQVAALILNGRIRTTETRAKAIRPVAEKLITLGKQGDLAARRQAAAVLNNPAAVKHLFEEVAPKYAERQGGYTRILRVGVRRGDAAPIAQIELV